MINCSHTHAGPAISLEDRDKPGGALIAPYLDKLRDAVLRAVRRALETEAPGTLTWASGRCDLAGNRDLQDPSRERWVTGWDCGGEHLAKEEGVALARLEAAEKAA